MVTLKKCTKKGKKINCVVKYENTSDANIGVTILRDKTYMVDEGGERWDYVRGTALNKRTRTEIANNTYLTTKFIFDAQDSTTGTKFSLFIVNSVSYNESFKITFNDVYLN